MIAWGHEFGLHALCNPAGVVGLPELSPGFCSERREYPLIAHTGLRRENELQLRVVAVGVSDIGSAQNIAARR